MIDHQTNSRKEIIHGGSSTSPKPRAQLGFGFIRTACAFRSAALAIVLLLLSGAFRSVGEMSRAAQRTSSEQLQAQRTQIVDMQKKMSSLQIVMNQVMEPALTNPDPTPSEPTVYEVEPQQQPQPTASQKSDRRKNKLPKRATTKGKFETPSLKRLVPGTRQIPSFIAIRHRFSRSEADTSPCLCNGVASSNCSSAAHEAFCAEMDNAMQASSAIDSEALSPYFSAPRDVVELSDELFLGPGANVRAEAIRPLEIDVVITYVNGSVPEWQSKARAVYERWLAAKTRPEDALARLQRMNKRRLLDASDIVEDGNQQTIDDKSQIVRQHYMGDDVGEELQVETHNDLSNKKLRHTPRRRRSPRRAFTIEPPPKSAKPKEPEVHKFDVSRFRDWNELLYALRSIFFHGMCQPRGGRRSDDDTDSREAFVDLEDGDGGCPRGTEPWILRNVYVVVPSRSHIPFWLDASHKRIRIVTDEDLKKGESDQPTFNSNVVESLLHRIPGLSRFFLYFNNDMLLGRRVSLFDYFRPVAPSRVKGIKLPHDPASYMLMEPILHMEGRGMCGLRSNSKSFRTKCWQLSGLSPYAVLTRMLNYNRRIVYELFGLIPSHAWPAHLPFLIDRTILEEMMDVTLKGVVHRDHAFRADTDLWMAYLYPYYALLKREQFHAATVSKKVPLAIPPRDASVGNGKLSEEFIYVPRRPADAAVHPNSEELHNSITEKTCESFFSLFHKRQYIFAPLTSMEHANKVKQKIVANRPMFVTLNDNFPVASSAMEALPLFKHRQQPHGTSGNRQKHYVLISLTEIKSQLTKAEQNLQASCGTACQNHKKAARELWNVERGWELFAMQELMRIVNQGHGPAPWEI